jgi:membrane complex biogenesis BtpA family protein
MGIQSERSGAAAAVPRGLIGVVHLAALPGDPLYGGGGGVAGVAATGEPGVGGSGFDRVAELALADAEALVAGGMRALIVENFGSAPFHKGCAGDPAPPHQVAMLARVAGELVQRYRVRGVAVGVNCLRNDALAALGIAAAAGADFVRINVHTGAYVTDQGLIEGEAARSLRYRRLLEVDSRVAILADVLVKHATPLAPLAVADAVGDCLERGLADGVIVTGAATGAPVDRGVLEEVREAAGEHPVLLGSGLTPERVDELLPLADGAIVGTWVKRGGDVRAPVERERVERLVTTARGRFRRG